MGGSARRARSRPRTDGAAKARRAPERDRTFAAIQRARLLFATATVMRKRGAAAVTVSDIVAASGVSRRTFYELFDDREQCMREAIDDAIEHAARAVVPAWREGAGWRAATWAALCEFLGFLDDDPIRGALLVLDAPGAGKAALARHAEVMEVLVDAIDKGRALSRSPDTLSRVTAEGVAGALLGVVHSRMFATNERGRRAGRGGMRSLAGELMGMVVLPYLGPAAAAEEAARVAPRPSHGGAGRHGPDSLKGMEIRLTYRTARVLKAIAEHPGASNREVGEKAGIVDQGQVSKLLARLERARLVKTRRSARSRGEANAWTLTERGEEIERAIVCEGRM